MPVLRTNAGRESIGETAAHVWENNRPLALIVLTALFVGAYLIVKKSQVSNPLPATPAVTAPDTSTMAGAYPGSIANTYSTSTTTLNYSGPAQPPIATTPLPTPGPAPVPTPTPTPVQQNPISGVTIPLPAPAKSTAQFGSTGNVGQRVYVTLPTGKQYKVYGDSDSQLPKGTTFKPGGNNSWWYVLPGQTQQYLVLPG